MTDPYAVLGLPDDADDDVIRRRYLALVKEHPPEKHPQRFVEIRDAYEALRDVDARLNRVLFGEGRQDALDSIVEEMECQSQRPTIPLASLLALRQRS